MKTKTEKELSNVVFFNNKKSETDELVMQEDDSNARYCRHDLVTVVEKDRELKCRRCNSIVEPFNFILHLCEKENRYYQSVKSLRLEEKQRRQNIEKLIQIERNAKSRIRRAGNKEPIPHWWNEKIES